MDEIDMEVADIMRKDDISIKEITIVMLKVVGFIGVPLALTVLVSIFLYYIHVIWGKINETYKIF